jgi:hypothetical protein
MLLLGRNNRGSGQRAAARSDSQEHAA